MNPTSTARKKCSGLGFRVNPPPTTLTSHIPSIEYNGTIVGNIFCLCGGGGYSSGKETKECNQPNLASARGNMARSLVPQSSYVLGAENKYTPW